MKYYYQILFTIIALLAIADSRAQIPSFIPTTGLVAYYPLNGNLTDATGGGSNGIAYGTITYATDRFGVASNCYKGSGSGEGDIPVNNFPVGNATRSVSVFFKYKLPYSGGRAFISWGENTLGTRFGVFTTGSTIGLEYVNGTVTCNITPDTCWHNLVVTYPSTGGGSSAIKIYLDGILMPTSIYLPVSSFNTPSGTWHGMGGNIYFLPSYPDSWTGWMDDIGVWNRELTQAEVTQIWQSGATSATPPSVTGINMLCVSSSASLTGTGGAVWSSSNPSVVAVSSTGVVTGLSAGTATISYATTSSCSALYDTQQITVVGLPAPGAISGPYTLCTGTSATYTSSPAGGTWSSSNPSVAVVNATTGVVSAIAVGTAIITYSVTNMCGSASDTQMVTVVAPPVAGTISGPHTVCVGSSISMSDPVTGGVWSSSAPAVAIVSTGGVVSALSTGTTIISYTVSSICGTATDTQAVTVMTVPDPGTILSPGIICPGTNVTFGSSVPGGVWSSSSTAVVTINASSGLAGGVVTGTAIISYSVTNTCGTATDTSVVSVSNVAYPGVIYGPTSVCAGSSISLFDAVTGGGWSSSNPSVAIVNAATGIVTGVATGNAIITYTVTNACGTSYDTQMIAVITLPVVPPMTGPSIVCQGAAISLSDPLAGGVWSSSNSAVATVVGGVVAGISAGTAIISYTITNTCGPASDTLLINVAPLPDAGVITGQTTLCAGSSTSLTSTVAGGTWSSGSPFIATINAAGTWYASSAGPATITYTTAPDDNGCVNDTIIQVTVVSNSSLLVDAVTNQVHCNGGGDGSIALTVISGTGPYQYTWSNGANGATVTGLAEGTYSVVITDESTGCQIMHNYDVSSTGDIVIDSHIQPDMCSYSKGSIEIINVSGGTPPYSYLWSTGASGATLGALLPGSYSVIVKDSYGCIRQFAMTVPEDSCRSVVIHDVITPNGDGYNDVLMIEGINYFPHNTVQVFDKWGDLIYSKEGYDNTWDGGHTPDGTYFYVIRLGENTTNGESVFKGSLLIKR